MTTPLSTADLDELEVWFASQKHLMGEYIPTMCLKTTTLSGLLAAARRLEQLESQLRFLSAGASIVFGDDDASEIGLHPKKHPLTIAQSAIEAAVLTLSRCLWHHSGVPRLHREAVLAAIETLQPHRPAARGER